MSAKKISVSLEGHLVAWLGEHAERRGASVSAVIAEAVDALRQRDARREVLELLGGPATPDQVEEEVRRFLGAIEQAHPDRAEERGTVVLDLFEAFKTMLSNRARNSSRTKTVGPHLGRSRARKRPSR